MRFALGYWKRAPGSSGLDAAFSNIAGSIENLRIAQ